MKKLLIADDEINMQKVLEILFRREKYDVTTVSNGFEALKLLESGNEYDLILSDLKMPVMDGIELLKVLREKSITIPFVLFTAYGSIAEAVQAMKLGASDFITKPFNKDDLRNIVYRILYGTGKRKFKEGSLYHNDEGVIYLSDKLKQIMETVRKIAPSNLSVLLTGESGTGKGIIAKAIHNYAFPKTGGEAPFVGINCPAVPDSLLESELFGYKKGAFTGADRDNPGKISMADGGTLFLDEIGDLSLPVQAKLLKFLEEGLYEPLGSTRILQAHIRILSATNQSIPEMIKVKKFREDLFYRINSIILEIPPLRERKEDILPLSSFFIEKFSRESNKNVSGLSDAGEKNLLLHNWPGNIRELRNVIHRAVILSEGGPLDIPPLSDHSEDNHGTFFEGSLKMDRMRTEEALKRAGWNISAAARDMGISRGALRHRIKKFNLEISRR